MATCSKAPTWRGLIESGIERCGFVGMTDDWCRRRREQLEESDLDSLLGVAELVQTKLTQLAGGGEFGRWLGEQFKALAVDKDRSVIETLAAFKAPLVTTNYDGLINAVIGGGYVTRLDRSAVLDVVNGSDRRVLHLHGHWEKPESVVLGIRSYEAVTQDEHAQSVLQALGVTKSLLFVGCGADGLSDPNIGSFLKWLQAFDVRGKHQRRHYVLVRRADVFAPMGRIFALPYGEKYEHLAGFLQTLLPVPPAATNDAGKPVATVPPPRRRAAFSKSVTAYLERLGEALSRPQLQLRPSNLNEPPRAR